MDANLVATAPTGTDPEVTRLRAIEREYHLTMLVLAVLTERLLETTGGDAVEVDDAALTEAPDLRAWRNHERHSMLITIGR